MFYYRTYFFSGGRIQWFKDFRADSDDDARREAESHLDGRTVELWRGERLIATIEPERRYG